MKISLPESLVLGLGSGDLCKHLFALQHPGAKQPQAVKSPEDHALESSGQRLVHLKLTVSIIIMCEQAHEW